MPTAPHDHALAMSAALPQPAPTHPSDAPPVVNRAVARSRWPLIAGLVLLGLALALYLLTLDNGFQPEELMGGDLITHQYAQVQARPSNAPGYPLYTLGGWAWFQGLRSLANLPGGLPPNPIPLLSSYSTLWALAALALLYVVLLRLTRSSRWPQGNWLTAWLLSAFYAVTYFFWYYATTTEQYTSAIAQTLALVYVYLLWSDAVDRRASSANWLLVGLALLCGLSLAHMLTVALIVPPLVVAVLWQQPRLLRNWRMIALCVLAALLPLASYWYVWVRGAAHPQWWGAGDWTTPQQWFWSFVSTAQGRDELARGFEATCKFFDGGFPELIWQELSVPLLVLGLVGIAWLQRRLAFILYATLVLYVIFDWMYRCGNWYQVILPAYPLVLLGAAALLDRWDAYWTRGGDVGRVFNPPDAGAGAGESARGGEARRVANPPYARWARFVPALLLVGLIVWRFAGSWERADSWNRPGDTALDRAAVLLGQPLPGGTNLFAQVQDALALDYLVEIWGLPAGHDPRLRVVGSDQAGDRLREGETVLTTFDAAPLLLSELPGDLVVRRTALSPDWLELTNAATAATAHSPGVRLDREITPTVTLAGVTVKPGPSGAPVTQTPASADVTLFWALPQGWPAELGISLRPTQGSTFVPDPSQGNGAIVQVDAPAPMQGLLPPPEARAAGELVADPYRVPLPQGADGLLLIVYTREGDTFRNLLELPLELPR